MALTATGLGSGIDVNGMVTKLVQAETSPKATSMNKREAAIQAEISSLGTMKSALNEFKSAASGLKDLDDFDNRTTKLSSSDYLSASAGKDAVEGSYDIEVVQLAQAQRVMSGGVESADTDMGTGKLTLNVGSKSMSVDIGAEHQSLADIRDAINNADDNPGVTATIINADAADGTTTSRLVLSAKGLGSDNRMSMTVEETNAAGEVADDGDATTGLSQLAFSTSEAGVLSSDSGAVTQVRAAQDAQIKVMGQTVTRSSNKISDAIDGISLDLKKAEVGKTTTLTVQKDTSTVRSKIENFVESYNKMAGTLHELGHYDPKTKKKGGLVGDSTLRGVQSTLRRQMSATVKGEGMELDSLAAIGVTTNRDGTLKIDDKKLSAALKDNYEDVGKLFASEDGYAKRMTTTLESYTKSKGALDSRNTSLQKQLTSINDQREALTTRSKTLQDRYLKQFNAMDALVQQMTTTSSYLTQQLAMLPGFSR